MKNRMLRAALALAIAVMLIPALISCIELNSPVPLLPPAPMTDAPITDPPTPAPSPSPSPTPIPTPSPTPEPPRYNEHELTLLRKFFSHTDLNGVSNGEKLFEAYDENAPETWNTGLDWIFADGVKRVLGIAFDCFDLVGTLDLSGFSELTSVSCSNNRLAAVHLTELPSLNSLNIAGNSLLPPPDLSSCPELTMLDCSATDLYELDLSACPNLTWLNCSSNDLTKLDLSRCPNLQTLVCGENALGELDVSYCPKLRVLDCIGAKLTELDLSSNPALINLSCSANELSKLDLTDCPLLCELFCSENPSLSEISISPDASEMSYIYCSNCALTELKIPSSVLSADCSNNRISQLDLSDCKLLDSITCDSNELSVLNLPRGGMLSTLICDGNLLPSLNLSSVRHLGWLSCADNRLSELILPAEHVLGYLNCSGNSLTELELDSCSDLYDLRCVNNKLTQLDVSACANLETLLVDDGVEVIR